MAGTDQSVNLTGMLSGIANTIGQGYQINGMNAGQAMGNNIREAVKPKLDMNDPVSMREYSAWAGRNGQKKEAALMLEKAAMVEKEQALAKKEGAAAMASAQGMKSAADGDVTGLERSISEATQKIVEAGQAGDSDGVKMWQGHLKMLAGQRDQAKGVQTSNKGNGILHLENLLENPEVTEEQKRQIQKQLGVLNQDSKAVLAANNTKLSNMAVERQQKAAQEDALEAQAMQQIMSVTDPDALLDLELPAEVAGKLQGIISSRETMLVRHEQRQEKSAELEQTTFTAADRAFYEDLAVQAGEGVDFESKLNAIEETQAKAMVDGKWNSTAARTGFLKRQAQFENAMFNEYSAATSQEGRQKREAEDRAVLTYEKAKLDAMAGPTPGQIDNYMTGRRDEITPEEAERAVQAMLNQRRDNLDPKQTVKKSEDSFVDSPVPDGLTKGTEEDYRALRREAIPQLKKKGIPPEKWDEAIKQNILKKNSGKYFPARTPVKDFLSDAVGVTGSVEAPRTFSQ